MSRFSFAALVLPLALAACGPHYQVDHPQKLSTPDEGYRLKTLAQPGNSDKLFVILAFSGGGTRAAALSYGVLEHLRGVSIQTPEGPRSLLDEVDVISSISGGSFTAAYYGLFGDRVFEDFESRFLERNIQRKLVLGFVNPLNWPRLLSPRFDRIHLAAEIYHDTVFDRRTYADMVARNRRPFIIVNATDMALGARFEFTQDQFDPLCQDLSGLPVAHAVAASSAFPFLLSPITVPSHPGTCQFQVPEWLDLALEDREVNPRRFNTALNYLSYLDAANKKYIHLLDGGIADNIGLRGPLHALASTDSPWSILSMSNRELVDRVVVITVNAKPGKPKTWNRKANAPKIWSTFSTVTGAPMTNYSFETVELAQEQGQAMTREQQLLEDCRAVLQEACPAAELPGGELHKVAYHTIEVSFDALEDEAEKTYLKQLGTSFALPAQDIVRLRKAAAAILRESPEFQELLQAMNAESPN